MEHTSVMVKKNDAVLGHVREPGGNGFIELHITKYVMNTFLAVQSLLAYFTWLASWYQPVLSFVYEDIHVWPFISSNFLLLEC
jgi:hypothetical protein